MNSLIETDLIFITGGGVQAIMQGWFAHGYDFIPNNSILPIFVGTHLAHDAQNFITDFLSYFPTYFNDKEIGCRDDFTLRFCQSHKIKSYLSRCLTLTLPQRAQDKTYHKIFFVDVKKKFMRYMPKNLQQGEHLKQKWLPFEHSDKALHKAQSQLDLYKNEAKLVITTALHCAAPCIAMGIPVVLLSNRIAEQKTRFSALEGILPIWTIQDLQSKKIDFTPKALDIQPLKMMLLENLTLSIQKARGERVDESYLIKLREKISTFKVSET